MYNYQKYIGLTKGVLTITDIISISENKKRVIVKCKCSKCGQYSETRLDRFTIKSNYATHYCAKCRDRYFLEEAKSRYVGKNNGTLTCIDVVYRPMNLHNKYMAVCKCSRCGETSEVRPDRLYDTGIYTPKACSNCIKDLHKTITSKRYLKLSNKNTTKEYEEVRHDNKRLLSIYNGAKERNIEVELSKQEFIELLHKDCFYCRKPHADGIDRIDSKKNYSKDNVVPCCGICNIMKNKFSQEVFFSHVKSIYERHCTNKSSSTISKESTSQANGDGKGENP